MGMDDLGMDNGGMNNRGMDNGGKDDLMIELDKAENILSGLLSEDAEWQLCKETVRFRLVEHQLILLLSVRCDR